MRIESSSLRLVAALTTFLQVKFANGFNRGESGARLYQWQLLMTCAAFMLLPTATKGAIESHNGNNLIPAQSCEVEFALEQVSLRIEDLQVAI